MNSFINRTLFFSVVLFSLSCHANDIEKIAIQVFEDAVLSPSVPGISVAVADKTGIKWAKGFGFANLEHKVPMTAETKMRIGSVAKVITTAALMRLYEKGLIDFNKDIRSYVPQWPEKHKKITLKQLVSHTSGIRHYKKGEFLNNGDYKTTTDALDIFMQDELLFVPGQKFSYSTYAWTLVSAAMESAAGDVPFKSLIREQVLTPLNLSNTTFDDNDVIISNRQSSYSFNGDSLVNAPEVFSSYKYAGGGFLATPSDVSMFAIAHTNQNYLKSETLQKMFTKLKLTDESDSLFGIGWMIGFDRYINKAKKDKSNGAEFISLMKQHPNSVMHSGGSMGGVTMMILCLDHNHSVTVVKNVSDEYSVNVFNLALKTLDLFTPEG
ncbi:MAG: beta-lactamase family protein [Colwellia sp.]|nr:beta-lactamase family protein [Colwellia sp.]